MSVCAKESDSKRARASAGEKEIEWMRRRESVCVREREVDCERDGMILE